MAIGTPTHILSAGVTDTATSATIAGTTNTVVPSGAMIVALVANRITSTAALSSFAGGGYTWTVVASAPTTARGVGIAYTYATTGLASGTTLTGTLGGNATRKSMDVFYVTGLANTAHDRTATAEGTTGAADTGASAATTQADEIVIAAMSHNAAAATDTGTPGGSYTQLTNTIAGTSTWCQLYGEYLIVASTGTQDATATFTSTTTGWSALLVTFKGAAVVAPPRPAIVHPRFVGAVGRAPMAGWR